MSSEGRDRTKQIQKQEVLHPMVRPGGLKNPAFSLMSSEGRDRTKQIQKQEVLHPMVRPGGRVHWTYYPETCSS